MHILSWTDSLFSWLFSCSSSSRSEGPCERSGLDIFLLFIILKPSELIISVIFIVVGLWFLTDMNTAILCRESSDDTNSMLDDKIPRGWFHHTSRLTTAQHLNVQETVQIIMNSFSDRNFVYDFDWSDLSFIYTIHWIVDKFCEDSFSICFEKICPTLGPCCAFARQEDFHSPTNQINMKINSCSNRSASMNFKKNWSRRCDITIEFVV